MKRLLLFLNILILVGCSELTRTKDEISQNAQVYEEDAFSAIELANNFSQKNNNIHLLKYTYSENLLGDNDLI